MPLQNSGERRVKPLLRELCTERIGKRIAGADRWPLTNATDTNFCARFAPPAAVARRTAGSGSSWE
jgi:hypothetical protein